MPLYLIASLISLIALLQGNVPIAILFFALAVFLDE